MSANCFVREQASAESIVNVTSVCAECYRSIVANETIFYDMQSYRYLCERCKDELQEHLDNNCIPLSEDESSLFSI
jgi:predicted amidophosphoribosyltransferase